MEPLMSDMKIAMDKKWIIVLLLFDFSNTFYSEAHWIFY